MADVQITCITKLNPRNPYEQITHIGSMKGTCKCRIGQVIASFELKNTFHVVDPSTHGRSEFGVVRSLVKLPTCELMSMATETMTCFSLAQCP
jgi:hypothetical protein